MRINQSCPKVLVYKTQALPLSETFIREQMLHLSEWESVLVCRAIIDTSLDLSSLNVRLLEENNSFLSKVFRYIRRTMKWAATGDLKALRKENGQVMHVHFGTEAVRVWPLVKALGLPMLVTLHGYDINTYKDWWKSGGGGRRMKNYPSQLLRLSKYQDVQFIAVSDAIKKRAIEYGISPKKIHVRYIGVDTDKFVPGPTPIEERKNILFVGRLVEKKGCRYILEAFQIVQEDYPDINLTIIGVGPLEEELEKFAKRNGVRATFLGAQTPAQVRKNLDKARMMCLPSIVATNGDAEGFGIVLLEAQACGVPVITSASGGAQEGVVNGLTGFTHDEKDVGAMVKAMRILLNDGKRANEMGIAARCYILKNMDVKRCTRELESLYCQVLSDSECR